MTPAATRRPTRIGAHHRSGRADHPMTAATRRPPAAARTTTAPAVGTAR